MHKFEVKALQARRAKFLKDTVPLWTGLGFIVTGVVLVVEVAEAYSLRTRSLFDEEMLNHLFISGLICGALGTVIMFKNEIASLLYGPELTDSEDAPYQTYEALAFTPAKRTVEQRADFALKRAGLLATSQTLREMDEALRSAEEELASTDTAARSFVTSSRDFFEQAIEKMVIAGSLDINVVKSIGHHIKRVEHSKTCSRPDRYIQ